MSKILAPKFATVAFFFYYWAIFSSRIGLFIENGNTKYAFIDGMQLAFLVVIATVVWLSQKRWAYMVFGLAMVAESLFSLPYLVMGMVRQPSFPVHFVFWLVAILYFLVAGAVMVVQAWKMKSVP